MFINTILKAILAILIGAAIISFMSIEAEVFVSYIVGILIGWISLIILSDVFIDEKEANER